MPVSIITNQPATSFKNHPVYYGVINSSHYMQMTDLHLHFSTGYNEKNSEAKLVVTVLHTGTTIHYDDVLSKQCFPNGGRPKVF